MQAASESTLEEAEGIHVSAEACLYEPLPALISMARFTALRSLVLRQACGFALSTGTPQLPPSLGCPHIPWSRVRLHFMFAMRRLQTGTISAKTQP